MNRKQGKLHVVKMQVIPITGLANAPNVKLYIVHIIFSKSSTARLQNTVCVLRRESDHEAPADEGRGASRTLRHERWWMHPFCVSCERLNKDKEIAGVVWTRQPMADSIFYIRNRRLVA